MKTRHVLITLAGAAVIAGTSACGTPSTPGGASSETVTTPPSTSQASAPPVTSTTPSVAAASTPCTVLGGSIGADRVCTVHVQTATYTIDMTFPDDYPDPRALTDVLVRQRDQFVQTVNEQPPRDVQRALGITSTTYRSGSPDTGTQSLVLEEYVNVGGAHPETYYDALNFDLTKRAPVTFETLFTSGADAVAVLDPIVENELKNRLQGAPVDANPIGAEMYKNFALTDDAVIFFIGQGMWTIEAAGAQQVSVPRSQLAAILA